ncbi:scabin-related ADP-ribosyltransferase [Streptomyces axinellae]|uniref:Pierisin-like domain-containing protein n=1 Tax=Streptomyces axinellae TaxID=552788 RepID=A0ABN3QUB4_9ACTN
MPPIERSSSYPPNPEGFPELIEDYGIWRLLTDYSGDLYAAQFKDGSLVGYFDVNGPRAGNVTNYKGEQFSWGQAPAWNWYDSSGELIGSSLGLFDSLPEAEWTNNSTTAPDYWTSVNRDLPQIHPAPVWAPTGRVRLWRNSEYPPDKIFGEGFLPEGEETPNLLDYVYNSRKNTTYISLTTTENYVQQTAEQSQIPVARMKYRWAYRLDIPHNAINVNATLDIASPFPVQQEYIVPGSIPLEWIKYAREIDLNTGALKRKQHHNPYHRDGSTSSQSLRAGAYPPPTRRPGTTVPQPSSFRPPPANFRPGPENPPLRPPSRGFGATPYPPLRPPSQDFSADEYAPPTRRPGTTVPQPSPFRPPPANFRPGPENPPLRPPSQGFSADEYAPPTRRPGTASGHRHRSTRR